MATPVADNSQPALRGGAGFWYNPTMKPLFRILLPFAGNGKPLTGE